MGLGLGRREEPLVHSLVYVSLDLILTHSMPLGVAAVASYYRCILDCTYGRHTVMIISLDLDSVICTQAAACHHCITSHSFS